MSALKGTCDYCDTEFEGDDGLTSDTVDGTFCCSECLNNAEQDAAINRAESRLDLD